MSAAPSRLKNFIALETPCACPFSIAQEYTEGYLRRTLGDARETSIELRFAGPLPLFHRRVSTELSRGMDPSEPGRTHDEVRLRWRSERPLVPDFCGFVRYRIAATGTLVRIEGEYAMPTFEGLLGGVVARWLARRTLRDLLMRIKRHLERQHKEWYARSATFPAT